MAGVGPTAASIRRTETLKFATHYVSKLDVPKIERSETFAANYGPCVGTLPWPPVDADGDDNQIESEKWQKKELQQLDAQEEWNALGIAICPGLLDAVSRRVSIPRSSVGMTTR
jgi:hypothetical protein